MEIRILAKDLIDPIEWNIDIKNPTQLFEFANTSSKFSIPYFLIIKDKDIILSGIVKRRTDGMFVLENKNRHKSIPLIELKASGVKLINLQNHKIYFVRKNNKTKEK